MNNRLRLILLILPCLMAALLVLSGARCGDSPKEVARAKAPASASDGAAPLADWPQPAVLLAFTGRQHGYIEPCGCTGLSNQKGGLNRRYSFLEQVRERGWDVVPIDIGNQVRRFGRQPEIKFQTTVAALREMDYDAVAFGPDDLQLSTGEVFAAVLGDQGDPNKSEFFCANARLFDMTPQYKIIESGGVKIGVTAVLGEAELAGIQNDDIETLPTAEALAGVMDTLEAEECDVLVLLAQATIAESKQLAQEFPEFDVVVTAGGAGEPAYQPEEIKDTSALLIQVGVKGMHVSALGVYPDEEGRFRFQVVPLDARFPDARPMLDLMAGYQNQLEELGLEGLGITPQPHPSGRRFVGSETCADCHTDAWSVFADTPHAHATDSISHPTERSEIPRHFDPECLSCHVTGWNPQGYFPYVSGYTSLSETPHLAHNGCENCHGPGSAHVAAEMGEIAATEEERAQYQAGMRLTVEDARETCLECHDIDNSPDFHEEGAFDRYWEQVEHHGRY